MASILRALGRRSFDFLNDTPEEAVRRNHTAVAEALAIDDELMERDEEVVEAEIKPAPYVPITYKPVEAKIEGFTAEELDEYVKVAESVGVLPDDLRVAEFTAYLRTKPWPVFDRKTVVDFMDEKSMREGARGEWGWKWVPLREKDRIHTQFGTPATRARRDFDGLVIGANRPASDYYSAWNEGFNNSLVTIYNQVVPLHALKKIAEIESEFTKHPVAFMVSDYAPAPEFRADPFLLAVINNPRLAEGHGRFVIDVWDEPNFGIEKMLKSGI